MSPNRKWKGQLVHRKLDGWRLPGRWPPHLVIHRRTVCIQGASYQKDCEIQIMWVQACQWVRSCGVSNSHATALWAFEVLNLFTVTMSQCDPYRSNNHGRQGYWGCHSPSNSKAIIFIERPSISSLITPTAAGRYFKVRPYGQIQHKHRFLRLANLLLWPLLANDIILVIVPLDTTLPVWMAKGSTMLRDRKSLKCYLPMIFILASRTDWDSQQWQIKLSTDLTRQWY